jgi:DNA ligase 1
MPDLQDGQSAEIQGSAAKPYTIKNVGGVYSCSCPAMRNQSLGIERRSCKHIRQLRGEQAETERIGNALPPTVEKSSKPKSTVPGLLLAQTWTNDTDVTGYFYCLKPRSGS